MSASYKLKVITPDKTFFDDETEQMTIRTTEGDVGILADHISYVAALPSGPMKIKLKNGEFRAAAISGGMLSVSKERVTVIATAVEWADEIDITRAKHSEEDAREKLKIYNSGREFEFASLKLKRALNRLEVSQKK